MSTYIEHITEDQNDSRKNGDVQVVVAGDKEEERKVEITGNQSKEYYKK